METMNQRRQSQRVKQEGKEGDDVDKRKWVVKKSTQSPFMEVAFCGVHSCRLWKWRFAVYIVAVYGSGILRHT